MAAMMNERMTAGPEYLCATMPATVWSRRGRSVEEGQDNSMINLCLIEDA